ncbi:hypothetical protein BDB01DRAFT_844853 [Pilobolus umbonatus]|nr:hypothetical protein BDB01DRAFT_844853 [Pilobolus umbonatus]
MMGYEFANYVNQYLSSQGVPVRTISKIDSNPEKSKHLETATTKLFGLEIDFCNLRTEVYDENSRIPSNVAFGSPREDAYRRDITINSLFYNVHTHTVEDFTKKGISDLEQGLIRTPLPPFETFKDDPLRVIRCVRFASRFQFDMVPELVQAAQSETIKHALLTKISRERIGIEFEKMIVGPHPVLSLQLIQDLDLYSCILAPPPDIKEGAVTDTTIALKAAKKVEWLCHLQSSLGVTNANEKRTLYLGASALPYLNVMCEVKHKLVSGVMLVLRDSIKTSNACANTIATIFRVIPHIKSMSRDNLIHPISRSEVGGFIRDVGAIWSTAVRLSLVTELLTGEEQEIVTRYEALLHQVHQYQLEECYLWKPLIDGKRMTSLLNIRPGPQVARLLKVQMGWQLDHPEGTKETCEEYMQSYWQQQQQQQQ